MIEGFWDSVIRQTWIMWFGLQIQTGRYLRRFNGIGFQCDTHGPDGC